MTNRTIENLVLEGGSVKTHCYIGAILKLEELGILQNIKRFAGASAGSLFAALLAANFTAQEIAQVGSTLDFSYLAHNSFIRGAYSIFRYSGYGIHSSDIIRDKVVNILSTRNISASITLKELYEMTKKDLVIVTSNLNREKSVYLHHAQYPDVKLVDAMMCSIGVPILIRSRIESYIGNTNDYYVDGGLTCNFPLHIYNDIDALYTGTLYSVEKDRVPSTTIGLKILTPGETNSYDVVTDRKDINSFESYLIQLLNTMMAQIDRSVISESYIRQTIPIHVDNISFLDFNLTQAQKDKLVEIGKESVEKYYKSNKPLQVC